MNITQFECEGIMSLEESSSLANCTQASKSSCIWKNVVQMSLPCDEHSREGPSRMINVYLLERMATSHTLSFIIDWEVSISV